MSKASLLIAPHPPFPEQTGASTRTLNVARYLARMGQVDLAHSSSAVPADAGPPFASTRVLPTVPLGPFARLRSGVPWPLARYAPAAVEALSSVLASRRYDVIVLRYLYADLLPLLPALARHRVILDLDDILAASLYERAMEAERRRWRRVVLALNRPLLAGRQRRIVRSIATSVSSPLDAERLEALTGRRPVVVPNIYPVQSERLRDLRRGFDNGHDFLFVGALGYGPNADGLRWFLDCIWPAVRQAYGAATLLVVGRGARSALRERCDATPGVELVGAVDDLRPFYARARAVVVPLLHGSGTRIKILEAAIAGRPILSTPVGAEGLAARDGHELLLFRTAEEFVRGYATLAASMRYDALVAHARAFVEREHSPLAFDRAMDAALASLP